MAKIPKSGISNAQTIQASHITNIIEALDGTGSYDIDATGSFSGSFEGSFSGDGANITGVTAEWDGSHVGNASITGSLDVTGDVTASAFNGSGVGITGIVSSSYAVSSSYSVSSSLAASASRAENIATADLTLDGDHAHALGGNTLQIGGTGILRLTPDTLTTTASFNHSGSFTIIGNGANTLFSIDNSLAGGAIFNSSNSSANFRIATADDNNAFFVNSQENNVGIGTDTPTAAKLEVNGNVLATSFSGSFSGSFEGDGSGLTGVGGDSFPYTGSAIISGSLTVVGNISGSLTLGTTRTTKEHNYLDNDPQISSALDTLGIYAGSITSINLRSSNANYIRLTLPSSSINQLGDRYEFILSEDASSGGLAFFRLSCATGDRMYGSVIGADGKTQHSTGSVYITSGGGNGRAGDRITVTSIGFSGGKYWAVEAIVSGSAGYQFV